MIVCIDECIEQISAYPHQQKSMYTSTASTYTYWNDWSGSTCVLTAQPRQVGHFQVPKNCTSDAKTEKLRPLFLCKHTPKWWVTYLFYAFNTSGWVLSQLFKNWLIWSLFLLLKWRTWLGCGVTGWTNFKVIFLFLLLTIHNLATIGAVAGGFDNFLIFWAALLPQARNPGGSVGSRIYIST